MGSFDLFFSCTVCDICLVGTLQEKLILMNYSTSQKCTVTIPIMYLTGVSDRKIFA